MLNANYTDETILALQDSALGIMLEVYHKLNPVLHSNEYEWLVHHHDLQIIFIFESNLHFFAVVYLSTAEIGLFLAKLRDSIVREHGDRLIITSLNRSSVIQVLEWVGPRLRNSIW